ncbi:MAG: 30S ribosomal protein S4 [Candidatus Levybacteria bacterium]|nr:30S ribosomal protein S4 [Candidatus Levybacteria bacterium]
MARYIGPKHKLARREGVNILDKQSPSLLRRLNTPPGMHVVRGKKRMSEYGEQLREKQKAKAVYGLLEKQFKSLVRTVEKKKGETGEMLIQLLETRLDNIVYRLGFAKTRAQARQFVSHKHILVNGKKINIPSFPIKIDDVISLVPAIQNNPQVVALTKEKNENLLPFLKREALVGKLIRMPKREDLVFPFDLQQIIEYYSR